MAEIKKVVFIGNGNVGSHLSKAFFQVGIEICGFYGRNIQNIQAIAEKYQTKFGLIEDMETKDIDLIILAVPDHAIEEVIQKIPSNATLIAHTSGSLPMKAIEKASKRVGVFYPLQTFSKEKAVTFSEIPLMLETSNAEDLDKLETLANKISNRVFRINSIQRKKIHIAAVFSSNFTNYLFHIAEDILNREEVPFDVIRPLIEETTQKIRDLKPFDAQTGPAVRRDMETINKHIEDLNHIPEYQEIYKLMSHHIIKSREQDEL